MSQTEDTVDGRYHYGIDPLSRHFKEKYGNDVITPVRLVSVAPKPEPDDTLPRGPVGPPGGTLPNHRALTATTHHSPRGKDGGRKVPQVIQPRRNGVKISPTGQTGQTQRSIMKSSPLKGPQGNDNNNTVRGQNLNQKLNHLNHRPPQHPAQHTYENAAQLRLSATKNPPHEHRFARPQHQQQQQQQPQQHSPQQQHNNAHIYENTPAQQRQQSLPPYHSHHHRNNNNSAKSGHLNIPGSYSSGNQPQPQAPVPSQSLSATQRYTSSYNPTSTSQISPYNRNSPPQPIQNGNQNHGTGISKSYAASHDQSYQSQHSPYSHTPTGANPQQNHDRHPPTAATPIAKANAPTAKSALNSSQVANIGSNLSHTAQTGSKSLHPSHPSHPSNTSHPSHPSHPSNTSNTSNTGKTASTSSLLTTPAAAATTATALSATSLSPAISATSDTVPNPPYRGIEKHAVPYLRAPRLDFDAVRTELLAKGHLYEDPEFPAEDSSLYYSRYPPYKITWMRPKEIAAQYGLEPQLFVDGISRFDLQQGELGDCWLVAAAACMSESPSLLERVLPPGQSFHAAWYAGMFRFRFWYGTDGSDSNSSSNPSDSDASSSSGWQDVVIDDRLPTRDGRLVFVRSGAGEGGGREGAGEFWGALLEKAYAKRAGSYEALKGGHVADALTDFTGGIVESYDLKTRDPPLPSNLSDIVAKALENNCLVGCGIDPLGNTQEAVLPNGLVCGHAYSITDLKEVPIHTASEDGRVKLVRVRNPWGTRVEWAGPWADRSAEWTAIPRHRRQTLGLVFRDDGEFWMAWNDFLSQFHTLDVCYLGPGSVTEAPKAWRLHTFHGRWRPGVTAGGRPALRDTHWSNPQYRVILQDHDDADDKCSFVVELMQKDNRKLRYKGIEKITMGFVIYQLSKSYKLPLPRKFFERHWFCARCDVFTNARQIVKRLLLPPGEYVVVPSTYDADVAGRFSLRLFFESDNNKALDTDEATELIEPEPPKPEPAPQPDRTAEFQKMFHAVAGQDMAVDAYELQEILNQTLAKDPSHSNMSIDACKSLLSLVDVQGSGKLDFYEFRYLWDMLASWRRAFYTYDRNKSGFINGYELKQAVAGLGYRLSGRVLGRLMSRYANRDHHIDLDNFISCMAKILALLNVFKQQHQNESCTFTLNQWMEVTIAL